MKNQKFVGLQINLVIFLIVFTIGGFSTALSQTSNLTQISYDKLNEFAKFVEYKSKADSLIKVQISIIETKVSLLENRNKKILKLQELIELKNKSIESREKSIRDLRQLNSDIEYNHKDQLKHHKKKKWQWLFGGIGIGLIGSIFF